MDVRSSHDLINLPYHDKYEFNKHTNKLSQFIYNDLVCPDSLR